MDWISKIIDAVFSRHPATDFSGTRSWISYGYQDAAKDLTKGDRQELQRLARYHEAGNAIVNRMADLWECYVVGAQGLQIFPASSSEEWNLRAAEQWNMAKPMLDISTRDGFDVVQGRLARRWFVDGEVFVILTKEGSFPRIQIVEAHRCKSPETKNDSIVDGKEYDSNGRCVAYWFEVGDKLQRIDSSFVVHIMEPERINQGRGIPLISCVLNDLRDLDDLQVLEMRACKNAARIAVTHSTPTGEVPSGTLRRSAISIGNKTPANADTTQTRQQYYKESIGGETVVLQNGDALTQFMTNRPSIASREYWRYLTDKVCAGVGIPYVLVFPDSMQGTVYRGALDMANSFFRSRSSAFAIHLQRIWEWVVGNDPLLIQGRPRDWKATSIRPPRSVNVDVGRNSSAAINELAAGLRTYQSLYAEVGADYKKELEQKAKEAAFISELATKYGIDEEDIAARALPDASAPEPVTATDMTNE
jgi:capsid protein